MNEIAEIEAKAEARSRGLTIRELRNRSGDISEAERLRGAIMNALRALDDDRYHDAYTILKSALI